MLFERPLVEQFEAEGTGEVLGMKLLSHGRDALASNWFLALGTESTTLGMVVDLTVWLALQVIVVTTRECHPTYLQRRDA